jgi:transposase
VALIGALDAITRELVVHTSRTKRSRDFIALLEEIDDRYGPRSGSLSKPVVLILDNGPIHTSKLTTAALAARPWLTVEWLPRYTPELNDIERLWRDLKRHHLAHRTFADADHLERTIHDAVAALNRERVHTHPCVSLSIAA